jgi:hypothetical protein
MNTVVDAIGHRFRTESGKDYGMDGSNEATASGQGGT